MVDYPLAIPMFVDENRVFIDQNSHSAIVLHGTACNGVCSAQDIANFFEHDPYMASSHYVISTDGTVVQCVLEKDGAAANCCVQGNYDPFWQPYVNQYNNLNLCTLSIEHCHYSIDNSEALTQAQQEASFKLVAYLVQKYNIPLDHIKGHFSIDPIDRKNCPGNYPWNDLMKYLQGGGNVQIDLSIPEVAKYFSGNQDGSWTCKSNGFILKGELLKWYQNFGNAYLCGLTWAGLPLTNEIPQNQYQPNIVILQRFERVVACYDPNQVLGRAPGDPLNVVAINLYDGGLGEDPQIAILKAEITQLQGQLKLNIPQLVSQLQTVITELQA